MNTGPQRRWPWYTFALLAIFAGWARPAVALIEVIQGNGPVGDHNWPAGSVAVANLPTRIGWTEGPPFGGGQFEFDYRGDAAALRQALDAFATIRAPSLDLFVHDGGPADSPFLADGHGDRHYDWSLTLWNPRSWNQLYNDPTDSFAAGDPEGGFRRPVDPPRLDVYVGGHGIDFAKVHVPEGVRVTDERASAHGFADGSAVAGDVFDMATSKPVAGARVVLAREAPRDQWTDVAATRADVDGRFQLRAAPAGTFGVLASADGYAPRVLGYVQLRGDTYKRFTASLSATVMVAGVAVDTVGKPVAGADVRADAVTGEDGRGYVLPRYARGTTDAQGRFRLTGLPRGHLQLFGNAAHYAGLDVFKLYPVPAEGLTVRLTATGSIRGRVVDGAGRPAGKGNVNVSGLVAPAEEQLGRWSGGANTAADGTFHIEDVPPGEYVVTAMATNPGPAFFGKDPNAKTITVRAGATADVEVVGQ